MAEAHGNRGGLVSDGRWGGKGMVALYVSLLSGVVVALQYNPHEPYFSVSSLEILAPFGAFWRALHFYASQLFFLLTVGHFLVVLVNRQQESLSFRRWLLLVLSLVIILLILFTGYVLRADATGMSAGRIAENILLAVPFIGTWLDALLFALNEEGMKRVYVNHLIGLGLLWLFLSWDHLRRYRVSWRQHPVLVLLLIGVAAVLPAPMEPERLGTFHIGGPWFFLGLQELLRYVPPFWAGVVWPLLFLAALVLLHKPAFSAQARLFALVWVLSYTLLTAVGLGR